MAKKMKHYRLDTDVIKRIKESAQASGRTLTKVIEDAVLRRDRLSPRATELIEAKMRETGWSFDEVLDWCVTRNGENAVEIGAGSKLKKHR